MQFHDEFLTILAIAKSQNDLFLRLDMSEWFLLESYKNMVLELKLINCKDAQKSFEKINQHIGELIWTYEFVAEKQVFNILLDEGGNIEIECAQVLERKRDLTIDELFLKFQYLAESYQRESESGRKGWGKYNRITNLLKKEIGSELQNWEKKQVFFEQNNSESKDKARAIIRLCKKILNFIDQIDKKTNA